MGQQESAPEPQEDWMGALPDRLLRVKLRHLAIPGSHDSFSFGIAHDAPLGPDLSEEVRELLGAAATLLGPGAASLPRYAVRDWALTQRLSFREQLVAGVRYFDLRIAARDEEEAAVEEEEEDDDEEEGDDNAGGAVGGGGGGVVGGAAGGGGNRGGDGAGGGGGASAVGDAGGGGDAGAGGSADGDGRGGAAAGAGRAGSASAGDGGGDAGNGDAGGARGVAAAVAGGGGCGGAGGAAGSDDSGGGGGVSGGGGADAGAGAGGGADEAGDGGGTVDDVRHRRRRGTGVCFTHGLLAGPVEGGLREIGAFLRAHPREVVLLDFKHHYGLTARHHRRVLASLRRHLGPRGVLCPRSEALDATLSRLWERGRQAIVFYDARALSEDDLCPLTMIRSPWPKTDEVERAIAFLEEEAARNDATPAPSFRVSQLVLTPSPGLQLLYGSLRASLVQPSMPALVGWVQRQRAGPGGVNIVIADFVELADFIPSVLALNHALGDPTTTALRH